MFRLSSVFAIGLASLVMACEPIPVATDTRPAPPVVTAPAGGAQPVEVSRDRITGGGAVAASPITSQPARIARSTRTAEEQRIGDEEHPKIIAEFGGEVTDRRLKSYVDRIGRDLVAISEEPNERWTFTILDSPVINAFALPGGYVYVTRGLIALADNEAELAAVIGHEIGHITAKHSRERNERAQEGNLGVLGAILVGAVLGGEDGAQIGQQIGTTLAGGRTASYSRSQEFDADVIGIRYLALAGYDPRAQATFLQSLEQQSALNDRRAGRERMAGRVDFLATHPATGDRIAQARRYGEELLRTVPAPRLGTAEHLAAIDGMVYSDAADQGFVRNGAFVHPGLGFEFTPPPGWSLDNLPTLVGMRGPGGAQLVFDGGLSRLSPADYIRQSWLPELAESNGIQPASEIERLTVNGLQAARIDARLRVQSGVGYAQLYAIQKGEQIYRFRGLTPVNSTAGRAEIARAATSFRALSAREIASETPPRIRAYTVRRGDSAASIAQRMEVPEPKLDQFLVLNSLPANTVLRPGQVVKIVTQ
ncbi:putative Zn-dependent protease [Rubricella aquisinus]|uniref:Putative Zn-dependent protease n=1 Tax=Rubricella aquisinus TaxID=2028108 RepID=A0A840WK64_9RHOB|nr:M48 family metalloprotease [Rubricella aquisinus]MBB5515449.1 putative Zn-dependent protease [Rubricella aquisinus]